GTSSNTSILFPYSSPLTVGVAAILWIVLPLLGAMISYERQRTARARTSWDPARSAAKPERAITEKGVGFYPFSLRDLMLGERFRATPSGSTGIPTLRKVSETYLRPQASRAS
ncbi:MAG: hypothetical protein RAK24_05040, partial [TACK group archaeon]|nr:hypothetical protein [TACK group archaeon]